MTNFALDRKIGVNSHVDFVKIELTFKESVTPKDHGKKTVKAYSGFFVGILTQSSRVNGEFISEEYMLLTKDFKTYSLYNLEFFYVMSILVKNRDSRDLTIYKATAEEQKFADAFLTSILDYFNLKNRTELDKWLIRVESYNYSETDLLFIGEEEILLNINLNADEARKLNLPPSQTTKQLESFSYPQHTPVQKAPDSYKKYNYTTKEPMFFKRVKTKPSKKLIEKIKEAVILMGNNPTVGVEVEEENYGVMGFKGLPTIYDENNFDDYSGMVPM